MEEVKSTLRKLKSGGKVEGGGSEYVQLKFEDWKKKMVCMTCKSNENEIILTCGHMSCNSCIEESFNSRQRVCPVDRKKISKQDVIKIYWNGTTEEE